MLESVRECWKGQRVGGGVGLGVGVGVGGGGGGLARPPQGPQATQPSRGRRVTNRGRRVTNRGKKLKHVNNMLNFNENAL